MSKKIKGFKDTIDWYNANAKQYAIDQEKFPSIDLIDKFVKEVGKNAKVLDAGCASGRDCKLFKDRGLTPIGVDLSKTFIEIAKEKYPDIDFKEANFLNLPFENETFDGVWAHASLLHFETVEEVKKAIDEFYRILKKDGIIHVFVKKQKGEEKTEVISDKLSNHDRFFQWFKKAEIKMILEKSGFKLLELRDDFKDLAGREEVEWVFALAKKY